MGVIKTSIRNSGEKCGENERARKRERGRGGAKRMRKLMDKSERRKERIKRA